jgi:hypothetical protein
VDYIDPKTGAQIRNMYVTTDARDTPYLDSGGTHHMCSATMAGPGPGWLCVFPMDNGGAATLYYIIPETREVRFLGSMVIPSQGPWPACGTSGLAGGMLDDEYPTYIFGVVDYVVGGSCSPGPPAIRSAILRGEYKGDFSNVAGGSPANMEWVLMTPAPTLLPDLVHAFDSTFDVTRFPSCGVQAQGEWAFVECRRSSQASIAWYAILDLGDRQPLGRCTNCMRIIAATNWTNPVNRWTGSHAGYLAPGHAGMAFVVPGYMEGCSYDTSVRPCDPTLYPQPGMGPYASKLTADITQATTTFAVDGQPRSLSDYTNESYLMDAAVGDQVFACPGTTLAAAIASAGQTAIQVTNGAQLTNGMRLFIGANPTETVKIVSGGGTNTLGVSRAQQGSKASTYLAGTGVAQWYNDCRGNETMTITGISGSSWTVSRNTPAVHSVSAWPEGTNLIVNGQRAANTGIHYIWWQFLKAPHGETAGFIPEQVDDFYGNHFDWMPNRYVTEAYHVRTRSLASEISQPASVQVDPSVPFHGVAGLGPGNSYTRYPSVDKLNASSVDQNWFLDFAHFMGGDPFSANPGALLVGGTLQVYKYVFCTVALGNCGGSESVLHRKYQTTLAIAGDHILTDVSGPQSAIADGPPGAWTYCVANAANECVPGSAAGDAYANVPNINTARCAPEEHPSSKQVDLCLADMTSSGQGVVQFSMIPKSTGYGRRLTSPWAIGASPDQDLAKATPDGGLIFFRSQPKRMFLMTSLPFQMRRDRWDRSAYIPHHVAVPPPGMSLPAGTSTVAVQHGYAEYRGYCTTRKEACIDVTSGYIPPVPFSFASENPTSLPCAAGCSVVVPALSSRALYATIRYYDAGGSVLREDVLPPEIIAPAGFNPPPGTSAGRR